MLQADLLIVGAGPVGMALALALKDAGLDIVLADTRPRADVTRDARVLALSWGTQLTLQRLGVWPDATSATPITRIHISQQGGFGSTRLQAGDYGQPALGQVMSAGTLAAALRLAVDAAGITVLDSTEVTNLAAGSTDVIASLAGPGAPAGTLRARLDACAEGVMQGEDEDIVDHDYHQHALIARLEVAGSHQGTAFERFTPEGPVALLPHGSDYALVHVVPPERADALLALDDPDYLRSVQAHFGSRVRLRAVHDRLRYPLRLRYRRQATGPRTVWVGNAAQTLHPVAGQGFNLALRDVWALATTLIEQGGDPGAAETLAAHAANRRLDRLGTIRFTDSLVKLFSNDLGMLRHARGAGLFALELCAPLRHFIARRMMYGARAWP